MQQVKAIVLLLLFVGITVFPWSMIEFCIPQASAKEHHHGTGPSPCELRRLYEGKGAAYWPPMDCSRLSVQIDKYYTSEKTNIKPDGQMLAVVVVLFHLVDVSFFKKSFLLPPEPQCRSATRSLINTFRGPPLV